MKGFVLKLHLFLMLGVAAAATSSANDGLVVRFSAASFRPGDTLGFEAVYPAWAGTKKIGTLNLLIEDVDHTQRWKLRYPMLDGRAEADVVLPAGLKAGQYAFTFSLQREFFNLYGTVLNNNFKDDSIRCVVVMKSTELMSGKLAVDDQKQFTLGRLGFANDATVYFSPENKQKTNTLSIDIETPLDSAFKPLADTLIMMPVGVSAAPASVTEAYRFSLARSAAADSGTLSNVTVVAKKKTEAQKLEDSFVSGPFKTGNARSFDASELDNFSGYRNILDWLVGRIPGLSIGGDLGFSDYTVLWRGLETLYYIDEVQVDQQAILMMPPSEIELLKLYPPPFLGAMFGGGGGAIAIYTKRASTPAGKVKNKFIIHGYTPALYTLQVAADKE